MFGYYAYVGLIMFAGSLLVSLLLSWILIRVTKKGWVFSVIMILAGLLFFILKMPATAFFYIALSLVGLIVWLIKKAYNKND